LVAYREPREGEEKKKKEKGGEERVLRAAVRACGDKGKKKKREGEERRGQTTPSRSL